MLTPLLCTLAQFISRQHMSMVLAPLVCSKSCGQFLQLRGRFLAHHLRWRAHGFTLSSLPRHEAAGFHQKLYYFLPATRKVDDQLALSAGDSHMTVVGFPCEGNVRSVIGSCQARAHPNPTLMQSLFGRCSRVFALARIHSTSVNTSQKLYTY